MPIFVSSVFAVVVGFVVVAVTSPSLWCIQEQPLDILSLHAAFVDVVLALLVAFLILCNIEPPWMAQNQSFPHAYHPSWNIGPRAFDFQLLGFYIYHTKWFSRTIHRTNIALEGLCWLLIIHGTFGNVGLGIAMTILFLQSISYRDVRLSLAISSLNMIFAGVCIAMPTMSTWNNVVILNVAKVSLFWLVTTRTLSHVFEPLPPAYSPETMQFEPGFGGVGWQIFSDDFSMAIWLLLLGNVCEVGAGLPGRLLNPIIYTSLHHIGFRSSKVIDAGEVRFQAQSVLDHGWHAHPTTAEMYRWATPTKIQG